MGLQRIRTIKPEFFLHEDLARVSFAGRLLYIGLWTVADCVGRLEDRPTRLKALLFPYDPVNVDHLLNDLAARGFIRRYQAGDRACIDIPTFLKHQRPGSRELAHELPPCTDLSGSFAKDPCTRAPAGTGTGTGTGKEREQEQKENTARARAREAVDLAFSEFWATYPRHEAKQEALRAWRHLRPDRALQAHIRATLTWQRDLPQWREGKIPHAATYLHQRRWEDEPPRLPLTTTGSRTAGNVAAIARGLEIATRDHE
jgi:hypothetical protein